MIQIDCPKCKYQIKINDPTIPRVENIKCRAAEYRRWFNMFKGNSPFYDNQIYFEKFDSILSLLENSVVERPTNPKIQDTIDKLQETISKMREKMEFLVKINLEAQEKEARIYSMGTAMNNYFDGVLTYRKTIDAMINEKLSRILSEKNKISLALSKLSNFKKLTEIVGTTCKNYKISHDVSKKLSNNEKYLQLIERPIKDKAFNLSYLVLPKIATIERNIDRIKRTRHSLAINANHLINATKDIIAKIDCLNLTETYESFSKYLDGANLKYKNIYAVVKKLSLDHLKYYETTNSLVLKKGDQIVSKTNYIEVIRNLISFELKLYKQNKIYMQTIEKQNIIMGKQKKTITDAMNKQAILHGSLTKLSELAASQANNASVFKEKLETLTNDNNELTHKILSSIEIIEQLNINSKMQEFNDNVIGIIGNISLRARELKMNIKTNTFSHKNVGSPDKFKLYFNEVEVDESYMAKIRLHPIIYFKMYRYCNINISDSQYILFIFKDPLIYIKEIFEKCLQLENDKLNDPASFDSLAKFSTQKVGTYNFADKMAGLMQIYENKIEKMIKVTDNLIPNIIESIILGHVLLYGGKNRNISEILSNSKLLLPIFDIIKKYKKCGNGDCIRFVLSSLCANRTFQKIAYNLLSQVTGIKLDMGNMQYYFSVLKLKVSNLCIQYINCDDIKSSVIQPNTDNAAILCNIIKLGNKIYVGQQNESEATIKIICYNVNTQMNIMQFIQEFFSINYRGGKIYEMLSKDTSVLCNICHRQCVFNKHFNYEKEEELIQTINCIIEKINNKQDE